MSPSKEQRANMFLTMHQIRLFEEEVHRIFLAGNLHGTTHLYNGQEGVAVGICSALEEKDLITSTHRGHGHALAKGADINAMMAEIMGKETGICKGKGGSMHIGDFSKGNLGANGVVGGSYGIAVGAALAFQMRKERQMVVCFFGDGATNEGSFHEALNLASVWKTPVLFVCENNQYGFSRHISQSMNINSVVERASSYGIKGEEIDGNKCLEVYATAQRAREYVLDQGPMLLVCNTYRYMGHSKSDPQRYRSQEEVEQWKQFDPLLQMEEALLADGFSANELQLLKEKAVRSIMDAVEFAEASPEPTLETLTQLVYAE